MFRNSLQVARGTCYCLLRSHSKGGSCYNVDQIRTTVVVERLFPPQLAKKGQKPHLKKKHYAYRVVDRVHDSPAPNISCILTDYVEGIGIKGDVVDVKRGVFRNRLYPGGLAVYASPENLAEVEWEKGEKEDEKTSRMTVFAKMTLRQLSGMYLRIPMSGDNMWILTKKHVKVAFRKMGVELTEDCLSLPEEAITEPQEIKIGVTINGQETVTIPAGIYLVHKDASKNVFKKFPPIWKPSVEHSEN